MNIEGVNKNNFIVADNDGFLDFIDADQDEAT